MQFSSSRYSVTEEVTGIEITVTRAGNADGTITVDYLVSDATAQQRTDYEFAAGRLTFGPNERRKTFTLLITEDAYAEGTETATMTLSNPTGGATLGGQSSATLEILDDGDSANPTTNPIEDVSVFVNQHYHDFLNREGDPGGRAYWENEIRRCGNDAACIRSRRVGVSAAFFVEQEFQQTGYFIYRMYKASFGTRPEYVRFMTDRSRVSEGSNLEATKQAYAEEFVQRPEFTAKYPTSMSRDAFVDALLQNVRQSSGVDMSNRRAELIAEYNAGTSQTNSRARVVRRLIEYQEYMQAEYNRAFVLAQYFLYLRRDPDESGYNFWLNVLNNREPNNYRAMVCAFLTSADYQQRFIPVVTRTDQECAGITTSAANTSLDGLLTSPVLRALLS